MPLNIIRIFLVLLISINGLILSACHPVPVLKRTPARLAAERAWEQAYRSGQTHSTIITLIDYSLPANQKRLWVMDMAHDRLLLETYVSHGLNSGYLTPQNFSNQINSRASSLGAYIAGPVYQGRHGLSLRLKGISPGLNDQAEARAIVMHGAWYVSPKFIQQYGRPGRSWGCPAVPTADMQPLMGFLSHHNLVYVYGSNHQRLNKKNHRKLFLINSSKPNYGPDILALPVSDYKKQFSKHVPVNQLLRRRLYHQEWVALSNRDLDFSPLKLDQLKHLAWVHAEFNANSGKTRLLNTAITDKTQLTSSSFKKTNQFIRWLGL
jgi:hypothetical protein